jgi:integrase
MPERNAQRILDQYIEESTNGTPRERTFEEFTREVVMPLKTGKWKASTEQTTMERFRLYLFPALGNEPLGSIGRAQLQAFLDEQARRPVKGNENRTLSYHVVAHLRWDLNLVCKIALAEGALTKNPAALLYVPRHAVRTPTKVMTKDELATVLGVLGLRERLIVRLAGTSELRPGEVEGLQWRDAIPEGLRITRRVYRGKVDTPKTHRGVRTAALSTSTRRDLDEWANLRMDDQPTSWIFPSENPKTPVMLSNVLIDKIRPLLNPHGLGWMNYQVLRRTASTLLRAVGGADPKVTADLLGHTVDVNLAVYTRSLNAEQQAALDKVDAALESNGVNNKVA